MDYTKLEIGDRLKIVREALGLSQAALGEKMSVDRAAVSLMERKLRNVTERSVKDVCRELNVDYIWLTTGEGEMFVDSDDDFAERIDRIMAGENDRRKNLFKALLNASDDDIEALDRMIDLYVEVKKEKD